jgi:hypothetical protein
LNGVLLHYSYADARAYLERFAEYTSIEARALPRSFSRALAQSMMVVVRFAAAMLRRGALFDGPRGWFVAWYSALYPAVVAWKSCALRQPFDKLRVTK